MIKHLKTLKQELACKDIYVWGVGKKALRALSGLAFRGIRARGFVTGGEFAGESFMGLPVIAPDEFSKRNGAVLILDEGYRREAKDEVSGYGRCLFLNEALELSPELKERPCWIYGTAEGAWDVLSLFSAAGADCKGFLLTENKGPDSLAGLPVIQFDKAGLCGGDRVVISAFRDFVAWEIADHMLSHGFKGDIFIREFVQSDAIWGTDPFAMLDDALRNGKRIICCVEDDPGREIFLRILKIFGVEPDRTVSFKGDPETGIGDIWSLADEDPDRSAVLIHAADDVRRFAVVDALNDLGYAPHKRNYSAFQKYSYNRRFLLKELAYEKDDRLLYSIDYTKTGGIPGWAVYGDGKSGKKIMILGGSTSSEVYYPENWVSKFYKKLRAEGIGVTLYNGAHEANGVYQELQRLIRDIGYIKPDIVISLSGVNDVNRWTDNKFEKLRGESTFEYWRRMELCMKTLSEASGAVFISVLQPMNTCMVPETLRECFLFMGEADKTGRIFRNGARRDDFYIDILDLFHHREEMFIDNCHYSYEAGGIIADIIFKAVKEAL